MNGDNILAEARLRASAGLGAASRGVLLAGLTALFLAACGGGGGGGGGASGGDPSGGGAGTGGAGVTTPSTDYMPLAAGDRWYYTESSGDNHWEFQVDVAGTSPQGGTTATILRYTDPSGAFIGNDFYSASSSEVMSYVPSSADTLTTAIGPIRLISLPLVAGDSFQQASGTYPTDYDFDNDGVNDSVGLTTEVTVVGIESIDTPAGTFPNATHVRTTTDFTAYMSAGSEPVAFSSVLDDWYVPGVGRVYELFAESLPGGAITDVVALKAYRTGAAHGGAAPVVSNAAPAGGGTQPLSAVRAHFSIPMDLASLDAGGFTVTDASGAAVRGRVALTPDGMDATFEPDGRWASGSFTAKISAHAVDRFGNAATPASWSFTMDAALPTIASALPSDLTNVQPTDQVVVRFSEPLAPGTVGDPQSTSFGAVLYDLTTDPTVGERAYATVTFDGTSTFTVSASQLTRGGTYRIKFADAIADRAGNGIGENVGVTFTVAVGLFRPPQQVRPGIDYMVNGSAVGDLNGDGYADVFYLLNGQLYMRPGSPSGLGPAKLIYDGWPSGCLPTGVSVGDLDGDGRLDVLLDGAHSCAHFLRQTSSGTLVRDSRFDSFVASRLERVVDVDGDGRPDLVWADPTSNIGVALQEANGQMRLTAYVNAGYVQYFDVGDVNGDGRTDIVAESGFSDVELFLQQADGSFGIPIKLDATSGPVAIGDLNGDGRADVFVAGQNCADGSACGTVFYQQADGSLGAPVRVASNVACTALRLADVNGDGRLDVLEDQLGDSVTVLLQEADGTFAPGDTYQALGDAPLSTDIDVRDIDGDGLPDLVVDGSLLMHAPPAAARPAHAAANAGQAASAATPAPLLSHLRSQLRALTGRRLAPHD